MAAPAWHPGSDPRIARELRAGDGQLLAVVTAASAGSLALGDAGAREARAQVAGTLPARPGVRSVTQVHGTAIVDWAAATPWGTTAAEPPAPAASPPPEADGIELPPGEGAAAVLLADCAGVLVVGERATVLVHAGWRGVDGGIVEAAIERAEAPSLVAVGPSIGPCCFEVGEEVAERFPGSARPGRGDRPHLDLRDAIARRARAAGAADAVVDPTCTMCSAGLHSYRRDGGRAGRHGMLAW